MRRRKQIEPPKNDFAPDENEEIIGFSSEPVAAGNCISSFSFDDDETDSLNTIDTAKDSSVLNNTTACSSADSNNRSVSITETKVSKNNITPKNSTKTFDISNDKFPSDNRKTPVANGMAPPIDGEFLDTKRTYMLRASTVRKINELKSIHPNLNTYVSTIVDLAIANYYNYIVNEGGSQK
ncbi:hypothetical protein CDLVIII_2357 [Clostridium sp. DL-VIII]|uniref:hypothetical protein n=1 Tax=Clostridium sp. DL-VIII TaxID=641107 RepID=UPI00023AFDF9|nr:hypothetical protein [Clostridium sp. DL-VIII]EHI99012.1 hypothetical protein CDLVIII_2357 [Clostridium sp. DL-VIII]